jgi:enterochelin esterase-like enzyme
MSNALAALDGRQSVPESSMKRRQVALLVWILLPLLVVALLCWAIALSMSERGTRMESTPGVGAGAGDTGGANAIGEILAGNDADHNAANEPAPAPAPDSAAGAPVAAAQPAEGTMVAPETLEQGFLLIVEDKARLASPASPIYIAGNHNGWNPGEKDSQLQAQSDQKWRISIVKPKFAGARFNFKFTRGSWELEELKDDMSPPANRELPMVDISKLAPGEQPRIELAVSKWGDMRPNSALRQADAAYQPLVATGTLRRLEVQGGAGTATGRTRDLLVWLPPGYDDAKNASVTYPVLYLHDGQNLFMKPATAPGEWGVDETATDLIKKGAMRSTIIVGIPHSGEGRIAEYLPIPAMEGVEPQGQAHVQWLMGTVMPRVERAFRVAKGPENTGIGGSSMGAIISFYAATTHPETFGLLLAESLPVRAGTSPAWDEYVSGIKAWPRRVFMGMGGNEASGNATRSQAYVDGVKALDEKMKAAGLGPDRRVLVIDQAAEHTEAAWAKRLPQALSFLFPPSVDGTK